MVEQSRRACSAVANGEADCAIIGGDVPDELAHVLKVGSLTSLKGSLLSKSTQQAPSSFSVQAGQSCSWELSLPKLRWQTALYPVPLPVMAGSAHSEVCFLYVSAGAGNCSSRR